MSAAGAIIRATCNPMSLTKFISKLCLNFNRLYEAICYFCWPSEAPKIFYLDLLIHFCYLIAYHYLILQKLRLYDALESYILVPLANLE